MYTTYVSGQMSLIFDGPSWHIKFNHTFRPTWLVRTSDMSRVPGTDAINGYCTLSYSWNYSGELVLNEDGEYDCIDQGQHKLIRNRKNQEIEYVKFEKLVQQLCKDFEIDYIWYDKMCIDQTDKVKKHAEIKLMHKIYRNANFAVAMIPELSVPDNVTKLRWAAGLKNIIKVVKNENFSERAILDKCLNEIYHSEWYGRLWTLEEAIMSQNMVFVGKNAHLWLGPLRLFFGGLILSASIPRMQDLLELWEGSIPSTNLVLFHAHRRHTSKAHDRVYALANVYAGRIDIDVDYDRPIMELMNEFYGKLITNDLSVLCFGKPRWEYNHTLRGVYDLPSWTGISGTHIRQKARIAIKKPENYFFIDTKDRLQMHVKCGYLSVQPLVFPKEKDEELSRYINDGGLEFTHYIKELASTKNQEKVSRNVMSQDVAPGARNPVAYMSLTEECSECVVLDLPFDWSNGHSTKLFPVVVRQNEVNYRAIGILFVRCRVFYYKKRSTGLSALAEMKAGSFVIV